MFNTYKACSTSMFAYQSVRYVRCLASLFSTLPCQRGWNRSKGNDQPCHVKWWGTTSNQLIVSRSCLFTAAETITQLVFCDKKHRHRWSDTPAGWDRHVEQLFSNIRWDFLGSWVDFREASTQKEPWNEPVISIYHLFWYLLLFCGLVYAHYKYL